MGKGHPGGYFKGCGVPSLLLALAMTICLGAFGCTPKKDQPRLLRETNMQQDLERLRSRPAVNRDAPTTPVAPVNTSENASENQAPGMASTLQTPLTLRGAVDYAMTHNLDALVQEQERLALKEAADGAMLRMLPSLLADAEQSMKNNHVPSFSESFESGSQSLEPSISSDLHTNNFNVTLSWDLLNSAINSIRWRQARRSTMAAEERLSRTKQDVVLQVTEAFMLAVTAKDMAVKAKELIEQAKERTQVIDQEIEDDLVPRLQGLQSRVNVMELRIRFQGLEEKLRAARVRLAELLGLTPDALPELAELDLRSPDMAFENNSEEFAALEEEALSNRPELFERDITEAISLDDADAAMLSMFPSISPFAKFSYDGNSYLLRHKWFVAGLRLSWDLLSVPGAFQDRNTALAQARLEKERRVLLTLAVITQVRLALIDYFDAQKKLPMAQELTETRKSLMELVEEHAKYGKLHESMLLDESQNYLNARQLYLNSYATLVIAKARVENALGREWRQGDWQKNSKRRAPEKQEHIASAQDQENRIQSAEAPNLQDSKTQDSKDQKADAQELKDQGEETPGKRFIAGAASVTPELTVQLQ